MKHSDIIWLASYPRSGNTYLRTVLWHCFALRSASIYPNDLGGNKKLEEYTGHIEHGPDMQIQLHKNGAPLIKTHDISRDDNPAIYVIRDGRAATVSLFKFFNGNVPLEAIIEGHEMLGTWSSHVDSWDPWTRPNTLLLKYEELRDNLPFALRRISGFLKKDILSTTIPLRDSIAASDGRWVRTRTNWKSELHGQNLKRFLAINKTVLKKSGYL